MRMAKIGVRRMRSSRARGLLAEDGVKIFHPGPFERYFLTAIVLISLGWIGVYEVSLGDLGDVIGGICFIAVALWIVWMVSARIVLAIGRDRVLIRNPLRTHVVELSAIADVKPQYEGLRIDTVDGRSIIAVAVQHWNISLFLKRRTRADRITELIQQRAGQPSP